MNMMFIPKNYTLIIKNSEWKPVENKILLKNKTIEARKANFMFINITKNIYIPSLTIPSLRPSDYKHIIESIYEPYKLFIKPVENSEIKLIITGEKPNLETLPVLFYLNNITFNNKFDNKLKELIPFIKTAQKIFYNSRNYVPLTEAIKTVNNPQYLTFYIPYKQFKIPIRLGGKKRNITSINITSKEEIMKYINTTTIKNRDYGIVSPLHYKQEHKNLYFIKHNDSPATVYIAHNPERVIILDYDDIGLNNIKNTLIKIMETSTSNMVNYVYRKITTEETILINNKITEEFIKQFQ